LTTSCNNIVYVMRILVNDHSGHPFQVQLSRQLARDGYHVLHTYSASFQTPKGNLQKGPQDPANFDSRGLSLSRPFAKYSLRRFKQEAEYGSLLIREIKAFRPAVLISSNTPIIAQRVILKMCRKKGIKTIFWLQDIYGVAMSRLLGRKYGFPGKFIGWYFTKMECSLLQGSDAIVAITEDFKPYLLNIDTPEEKITVIPNWAPLAEIPMLERRNQWSKDHGLDEKTVLLYSGTLGMKHNPDLIVALADHFKENTAVRIVVISEGLGADYLQRQKANRTLDNLMLLGFQPFECMPDILAAADILFAILEQDAGVFSVPSKVLSYLCSGRPIVLSVPPENLAARTVQEIRAGFVTAPDDWEGFIQTMDRLVNDPTLRRDLGSNGRQYAERSFGIEKIALSFTHIIKKLLGESE